MRMNVACIRPSDFARPSSGENYTGVLEEITADYGFDATFSDFRPHAADGELPAPEEPYDAVVVTGSGEHVYDQQDWVKDTERYLQQALADGTPVLGICYGHQILASALGGTVEKMPEREMGYNEITLTEDGNDHPLFTGIVEEDEDTFISFTSHQDHVSELPDNIVELAQNGYGNHAYESTDVPAYGIQFHPEYSLDMAVKLLDGKEQMTDEKREEVQKSFTLENVAAAETSRDVFDNFFRELC